MLSAPFHVSVQCLSSNIAFGFGCSYISRYETQKIGLQWDNIGRSQYAYDMLNARKCMLMLLVDAVIYLLATWYIEAVWPGVNL